MGVDLVLRIFIFTIVSKLCSGTSGHSKRISHFRVLRQHRHIKECANLIMRDKKNYYIGGRVSDKTSICEGLPSSLKWMQSLNAEYGYFRELSTLKTFFPPIEVGQGGFSFAIPGTFDNGARLDFSVTMIENNVENTYFTITEESSNSTQGIQLRFFNIGNMVYFGEIPYGNEDFKMGFPKSFYQSKIPIHITFVAQKNSMQLILDDQEVLTKELKHVRLGSLRHVLVHTYTSLVITKPALFLHRFEFREA